MTAQGELRSPLRDVPHPNCSVLASAREPRILSIDVYRFPCEAHDPLCVPFQRIPESRASLRIPQSYMAIVPTRRQAALPSLPLNT